MKVKEFIQLIKAGVGYELYDYERHVPIKDMPILDDCEVISVGATDNKVIAYINPPKVKWIGFAEVTYERLIEIELPYGEAPEEPLKAIAQEYVKTMPSNIYNSNGNEFFNYGDNIMSDEFKYTIECDSYINA